MERYVSCLDFGLNGKLASFERDAFIAKMCHRTGLYSLSFSNTRLCRCFWRIAPMHCSPHEKKKKKERHVSSAAVHFERDVLSFKETRSQCTMNWRRKKFTAQTGCCKHVTLHTHTKQKKGSWFEPAGQINLPQTPKGLGDKPAQFPGIPKACSQTISHQGRCQKFQQFSGGTLWRSATASRKSQTWAAIFAACL